MKTRHYFAVAIAAILTAASCSVEEPVEFYLQSNDSPVFEAAIETGDAWHSDDRVSIFNQNKFNCQFKFDGTAGDTSGSFSAVEGGYYSTTKAFDYTYAVYPYSAKSSISNAGLLNIELPATQTYADGSFGKGANVMVAVTDDDKLAFKSIGGCLLLGLYGKDISVSSVSLKAKGGEAIAGAADVKITPGGAPTAEIVSNASSEIVLSCLSPVALGTDSKSATAFRFALPPVSLSKGFTVLVTLSDGRTFQKSIDNKLTITRNGTSTAEALEVTPTGNPVTPQAVDLGLSVKWAPYNVGATRPEQYGDYFAWGETRPKAIYSWDNYKWLQDNQLTKYVTDSYYGSVDNKFYLDPEDDAAHVNWGGNWRMPSLTEFEELYENCTMTPETVNGVEGFRFTSKIEGYKDASIFFPSAGDYYDDVYEHDYGMYWSLDIYGEWYSNMTVWGHEFYRWHYSRDFGASVRPVTSDGRWEPVTGISMQQSSFSITEGETAKLEAVVSPSNATLPLVYWTSDDYGFEVTPNGKATANYEGTYTVTGTTYDGHFTVSCQVTVNPRGYVPVPDPGFQDFLNKNIDGNDNGKISYGEAEWITMLNIKTDNIASLSGIEYFTNIERLYCYGSKDENGNSTGKLTSLDVSHNTNLVRLECERNQLTSLDVSHNPELTRLLCQYNQITNLNVTRNTALEYLDCGGNKLNSLDISKCPNLKQCYCGYQNLSRIDVSKNPVLEKLHAPFNDITSIDVSHNTELKYLDCGKNKLTSLDVSANTKLTDLYCGYNQISHLDVSYCPDLKTLHCFDSINLKEIWLGSDQDLTTFKYDSERIIVYYKDNYSGHPLSWLFGSYTASAVDIAGEANSWTLFISMDKKGHSTVRVYNIVPGCTYYFYGDYSFVGTVSDDGKTITIPCGQTCGAYKDDVSNVFKNATWEVEGEYTINIYTEGDLVFRMDDEGVWHTDQNIVVYETGVLPQTFVIYGSSWVRNQGTKTLTKALPVKESKGVRVSGLLQPHLGVLEEKEFLPVGVKADAGLEFGDSSRDVEDLAGAESIVFDAHSRAERRHR